MEENRVLLAENQSLKQRSQRKPKLMLAFDGDVPDEDDSLYARGDNLRMDDDDVVHLKVGSVGTALIEERYRPVRPADFFGELRGKVTDAEIETYNRALPSKEEVEEYLTLYRRYHMVVDHGIATVISIHNIGTAKATDVSVEIEFPEEIQVFDLNEVRKQKEPKAWPHHLYYK